jgi:hypothetical protein
MANKTKQTVTVSEVLTELKKLSEENPNDMSFGTVIRSYLNSISEK